MCVCFLFELMSVQLSLSLLPNPISGEARVARKVREAKNRMPRAKKNWGTDDQVDR